jgi:hypothetical protein
LQVTADGQTVFIADASFWRKKPGLIIGNALFERLFFKTPLERRLLVAATLGVVGISCIF